MQCEQGVSNGSGDRWMLDHFRTMSAIIVEEASTCIALLGAHLTEDGAHALFSPSTDG
jgi:hypothetical protein